MKFVEQYDHLFLLFLYLFVAPFLSDLEVGDWYLSNKLI